MLILALALLLDIINMITMVTQVAIPAPAGGHIGAWYLEPAGGGAGAGAVLYVHGVKGNRSRGYRVGLYNVLLKLGLKVSTLNDINCPLKKRFLRC